MIDQQLLGFFLAILAAFCWGSSTILYKIVLKTENIYVSVVIRGLFAVPFIAMIAFFLSGLKSAFLLFTELFIIVMVSSILVGLGELFFFGALKNIEASIVQPISSIYPLFTAFFLFLGSFENVSITLLIGIIAIVVGMTLVSQREKTGLKDDQKEKQFKKGILFSLLAALCWSLAIITLNILLDDSRVDVFTLAAIRFAIVTVFIALLGTFSYLHYKWSSNPERDLYFSQFSVRNILILGAGGILSWGIGAVCFFLSIQLMGAARATPISSINPLITVVLGAFFLREKLSRFQISGIALVTAGALIVA